MLNMPIDMSDLERGVRRVEREHVPKATVWALNDTADDVLDHIKDRMRVVFDRPTRFALNAFMVWRANQSTLTAEVKERPSVGARHFLKVQEQGGYRPATGLERFMGANVSHEGEMSAVVPAAGAKLNSFGNWSPSERNKVLTALQSGGGAQPVAAGPTKSRRRTRIGYFVPRPGSSLSAGVWKRSGRGQLTKILHFTTAMPQYDTRLGFNDGAQSVFIAQFPAQFERALRRVIDKA